jgi:peptidoglycan/LPS O-acetylase OafA/YrhL
MYDFGIVRVLFEFMLGVALYSTFEKSRVPLAIVRPMILLTLLAIGVLSYHQGNETIIVSFMGFLILLVAHLALDPRPTLLRHPILVYLGKISYATYLVHFLILIIAMRIIDRIPDDEKLARLSAYVSVFLAIYLASAFLYHVIETPSRIAIRRLFSENPVISKKG